MTEELISKESVQELKLGIAKKLVNIIILSMLQEKPAHGYDILRRLQTEFYFSNHHSTVYPAITYLSEHGYIDSGHWEMGEHVQRKIYSLTPKGQKCLIYFDEVIEQIRPTRKIKPTSVDT